jgi:hypothetical protein
LHRERLVRLDVGDRLSMHEAELAERNSNDGDAQRDEEQLCYSPLPNPDHQLWQSHCDAAANQH